VLGVRGFVEDMNGQPLRNAVVQIKGFQQPLQLTKNAAWFKALLPPGNYEIEVCIKIKITYLKFPRSCLRESTIFTVTSNTFTLF
jgi:hypothetical protein